MSQSPSEAGQLGTTSEYLRNWDRLGSLIAQGRSFSGRERNCCFLNLGQNPAGHTKRFADVSSAANLDLIDDCRGIAAVDWDQDGDMDLWQSTRTAPSIRFLRNDLDSPNTSVTIRLEGRSGNRDSIGARVQIELDGNSPRRLVQTLRAGDAFLSQSSKWLHFGLGQTASIRRVSVFWPGRVDEETFTGVTEPGRYRLVEGEGVAVPITQHAQRVTTLKPSIPSLPKPTDAARIVLTRRPKLSDIQYVDLDGRQVAMDDQPAGPVLITLWASWCAPCVNELTDFKTSFEALRQNGLRVVALSTDALRDIEGRNDRAAASALIRDLDLPFPTGFISSSLMQRLHVLHTDLFYHEKPLPIPTSFLIDRHGNLAVIYRGAVGAAQLSADVDLIHTSDAPRITAALYPLGGRSGIGLLPVDGLGFSKAYFDGGYFDDARREVLDYIRRRTKDGPARAVSDASRAKLAEAYHQLGRIDEAASRPAAAVSAYHQALEFAPDALGSRVLLARVLWQTGQRQDAEVQLRQAEIQGLDPLSMHSLLARTRIHWGQPEQAVRHFQQALRVDAENQLLRLEFAVALCDAGRVAEAVQQYRQLLADNARLRPAANNLAWLFATHPDAEVRNGPEALRLALEVCRVKQQEEPAYLDTLAAAYAESGRFTEATATARQAIRLAETCKQFEMANDIRSRLRLYEQQVPYRAPSR